MVTNSKGIKSMGLSFEWDRRKGAANLRKHGVSFDEASTVFMTLSPAFSTMKVIPKTNQERSSSATR
jgi:uncharacterized DUF497 family protein